MTQPPAGSIVVLRESGARGAAVAAELFGHHETGAAPAVTRAAPGAGDAAAARARATSLSYCASLGIVIGPLAPDVRERAARDARVELVRPAVARQVGRIVVSPPRPIVALGAATLSRSGAPPATSAHAPALVTLGLHAGYLNATGAGVRVAIIDTGIDDTHPDFATARIVARRNFVNPATPGDVTDLHGHGTMSAGLVGASADSAGGWRYALAPDAELVIAKAMNDDGKGDDTQIIEAICWAADQGAKVINLSVGGERAAGSSASLLYETVAARLLQRNVLLVAAAGDGSARPGRVAPVEDPAACASIMAVGAVDEFRRHAAFTPGNVDGVADVDLCAPGVKVHAPVGGTRWSGRFASVTGTSVSAPLVAGIAALELERDGTLSAQALWQRIVDRAQSSAGASPHASLSASATCATVAQVP